MKSKEVKVHFQLVQDEDDWPPFTVESIWCTDLGDGRFQVNNVPYFVKGVSFGDLIVTKAREGGAWFDHVDVPSRNSTVHIFSFDDGKTQDMIDWARQHDCIFEMAYERQYMALSVPEAVPATQWMVKLKALESVADDGFEFDVSSMRHP